ncbi:HTTM domain-containing protein [Rhodocytophaga rosea]|uniref:HTTM domain-containing protein n=1 Tax=Rhodocytophaga rosea TaxID=2704465 RepID=A0A6C0GV22_9BACT|nr:HTTM domain-containing protein [Rhodocytophaga rosea]QHT71664.1 HTTM domain-containing protein [Rhodocytophaga rosea]
MEKQSVIYRFGAFLNTYFFSQISGYKLGLIRIILVGATLVQVFSRYHAMHRITFIDAAFDFLHMPSHLLQFLSIPFPLPVEFRLPFAISYYLIGSCAMVGLFTRPAVFIFGLFNIYIFDIQLSRGLFDHEMGLISQVFLVLALAPGSSSFSIDRAFSWLLQRARKTNTLSFTKYLPGPPVPVWGLKLIIILLACTYFTAGLSKIRYGSLQWLDGKTLTHYLNGSASPYVSGSRPIFTSPTYVREEKKWKDGFGIYSYSWGNKQRNKHRLEIGRIIAANSYLMIALSLSTVIFELSSFLLLTTGWPKFLYLLGAIAMHLTIGYLMDLHFFKFQLLCLLLVNWQWVFQKLLPNAIKQLKKAPALIWVNARS